MVFLQDIEYGVPYCRLDTGCAVSCSEDYVAKYFGVLACRYWNVSMASMQDRDLNQTYLLRVKRQDYCQIRTTQKQKRQEGEQQK
jgi:hypothetical protein